MTNIDESISSYHLGLKYYYGDGVKKNYKLAAQYAAESASQGDCRGAYLLAYCYK